MDAEGVEVMEAGVRTHSRLDGFLWAENLWCHASSRCVFVSDFKVRSLRAHRACV